MEEKDFETVETNNEDGKDVETNDSDTRIAELEAKLEKTEKNFKNIAKKYNELKSNEWIDVNELVESKLAEVEFYNSDPVAKEFKDEIKAVQDQYSLPAKEAFLLRKAQNNKISPTKSEGVDWVEVAWDNELSKENLLKMSWKEFLDAIKANPWLLQ